MQARAMAVAVIRVKPDRSSDSRRTSIQAAAPTARANRARVPLQPARAWPSAISHSDSHSCATHGAPAMVKEKGSWVGTRPWARIHWPVARCQ